MATQLLATLGSRPITLTNSLETPVTQESCQQDFVTVAKNSAVFCPDDEDATKNMIREGQRRNLFQTLCNEKLGIPNGYRKVEVLLIRWDESIDDFKGHSDEIDRLYRIFKHQFNYGCTIARIRSVLNPQIDLNAHILRHLQEHDGKQTLLIVYYTGHGAKIPRGTGGTQLRLQGEDWIDKSKARPAAALWESAEEPLRCLAESDILAILDCCFASTAASKGSNDQTRAYELLAASKKDGETPGPGQSSFTTALCDSLEELLGESHDAMFPLGKLVERINQKPGQGSIPWDRLERHKHTYGKISLGRLDPTAGRSESFRKPDYERASLTLRFSLKRNDLKDEVIRLLAHSIPVACKDANLPVRSVDWVQFEPRSEHIIREVLGAFQRTQMKSKKRKLGLSNEQEDDSPRPEKQVRPNGLLLTPPTWRLREGSATSDEVANSGLRTPPRRSGRRKTAAKNFG